MCMRLLTRDRSAAPISPAFGPRAASSISAAGRKPRPVRFRAKAFRAGRDQQFTGVAESAADHELARVQCGGEVREAKAQPFPDVFEQFPGGRVPGLGQLGHDHARNASPRRRPRP